jgi:hypothetical protein
MAVAARNDDSNPRRFSHTRGVKGICFVILSCRLLVGQNSIIVLCREKGASLDVDYAACVSKTLSAIDDWDSHERHIIESAGDSAMHR